MTQDGNGHRPARKSSHMRRIAKLALPTGAALGAGAAIAAVAAGQDSVVTPTTTAAGSPAVFQRAASSYFLEIAGIKGESISDIKGESTDKYPGAIDVDYFAFGDEAGTTRVLGAGGAGAGRVHFDEFTFKKDIDATSPQLFQDSVTGEHLQKAVLVAVKDATQQEYLKITLTNVVVSSYHVESQQPAGEGEVETVTLDFQSINYQYEPQNPDGSAAAPVTAGWNLLTNKQA